MPLWRPATRGLRVLLDRRAADQDVDDELRHFVDESAAEYVARGLSPEDARRRAMRDVRDTAIVREQVRDHGWENGIAAVLFDLRFAARMLRKNPVFTLVVVLVISLGSGAVTTIF